MSEAIKFILPDDRLPKVWYNLPADLPQPLPPILNAATGKPVAVEELTPLFPMSEILQEVSTEREIEIPGPVRDVYRLWRPTPLRRAQSLERLLDTPARIFYKDESVGPTGSFKPNEAVPEAFYVREAGGKKIVTLTGAGQWGCAIAFAGALFGLEVKIFMVKVSYEQKPYRRVLMETYGATCIPSPSNETEAGRRALAADPTSPGSLGIAASETLEVAATDPEAHMGMSSVLNFTLLHHTVVGLEALEQMEMAGHWPDIIIGCVGGGSNFLGLVAPFLSKMLREGRKVRAIAAEPAACPSLTRGRYAYDFLDFRPNRPDGEDAHLRLEVYAAHFPCWGPALAWNGAAVESSEEPRTRRSCRAAAEGVLRGWRHVRPMRRYRPRAGSQSRGARCHR